MKIITLPDSCNYFYHSHYAVSRIVALTPEGCTKDAPTPQQLVRAPLLPFPNSWDYAIAESGIYEVEVHYTPRTQDRSELCVRNYYRYERSFHSFMEISLSAAVDYICHTPNNQVVELVTPNDAES